MKSKYLLEAAFILTTPAHVECAYQKHPFFARNLHRQRSCYEEYPFGFTLN